MAGAAMVTDPGAGRRSVGTVVAVVAGVAGAAIVAVAAFLFWRTSWERPEFASLADRPDPSLHGTVAYVDNATRCVRIVAAAGAPSKDVLCLDDEDPETSKTLGKPLGPQLLWRADGRLEVTMFRMTDPPGPGFEPGWQKVVDATTGAVEDVPAADVPSEATLTGRPTVSPSGAEVRTVASGGRVEVVVDDERGSRTLLSVDQAPDGSYDLVAFWQPAGEWIAADDGRILIITLDDPAVTRVLTDASTRGAFGPGDAFSRFAVTDADLLVPAASGPG
jgi:hypothetical protein